MIHQFKQGSGPPGVGFAIDGVDFDKLYGKIGECGGFKHNEKPPSSTNTKPTMSKLNTKDGVFIEPPKAPPQQQDQRLRTHLTLFLHP